MVVGPLRATLVASVALHATLVATLLPPPSGTAGAALSAGLWAGLLAGGARGRGPGSAAGSRAVPRAARRAAEPDAADGPSPRGSSSLLSRGRPGGAHGRRKSSFILGHGRVRVFCFLAQFDPQFLFHALSRGGRGARGSQGAPHMARTSRREGRGWVTSVGPTRELVRCLGRWLVRSRWRRTVRTSGACPTSSRRRRKTRASRCSRRPRPLQQSRRRSHALQ